VSPADFAQLVDALTTLAWPICALFVLLILRRGMREARKEREETERVQRSVGRGSRQGE
jgi:hypothetical protein